MRARPKIGHAVQALCAFNKLSGHMSSHERGITNYIQGVGSRAICRAPLTVLRIRTMCGAPLAIFRVEEHV